VKSREVRRCSSCETEDTAALLSTCASDFVNSNLRTFPRLRKKGWFFLVFEPSHSITVSAESKILTTLERVIKQTKAQATQSVKLKVYDSSVRNNTEEKRIQFNRGESLRSPSTEWQARSQKRRVYGKETLHQTLAGLGNESPIEFLLITHETTLFLCERVLEYAVQMRQLLRHNCKACSLNTPLQACYK
jgi:hypothetical protein